MLQPTKKRGSELLYRLSTSPTVVVELKKCITCNYQVHRSDWLPLPNRGPIRGKSPTAHHRDDRRTEGRVKRLRLAHGSSV